MGDALRFDGVHKRFRNGVVALRDVSWAIPEGSRACLLGPNGAGKSTSIRLLEGALSPSVGGVQLLGADVGSGGYMEARRRTGVVPQGPGMYADFTALEYLEMVRTLYACGEVRRVVEAFGLGEHLDKRMASLSGGFQRRLVLAAALLSEPDVLLLDEPTVGLDPVAAHEVHEFLKEAMAGRTALLCTHNLVEAEALCEDVIMLRRGEVVVHDTLERLRRRARTHLRLAARQGAEALIAALAVKGLQATGAEDGSVLVALDEVESAAPPLLRALLADGVDVYRCEPVIASLEDLFLAAMGAA